MTKGCAFCAIIAGEVSAHVVLEGERTLGFLDHRPLFPGHVLVVPRGHHETLSDLPVDEVDPFFRSVRQTATAVQAAMGSQGTFVAMNNVVSQSVPHLHCHVVPRTKGDGLRGFFWPRNGYDSDEHMADVARRLRERLGA